MVEANLQDMLWVLVCTGMVVLMQAGFLCVETGLTRTKNAINVAMKNLTDFGISILLYWIFGFSIMFGPSISGWIGTNFYAPNLSAGDPWLVAIFIFQAVFCATSATIISGAISERVPYKGYVLLAVLVTGFIYPVFGNWSWGGLLDSSNQGWLQAQGFVDFAGSTVVHSVGAWSALACLIHVGPRMGIYDSFGKKRHLISNNIPLAMLGVILLWVGWLGFNGGSTLALSGQIPSIILNTVLAGCGGLVCGMGLSFLYKRHFDAHLVMNGALAGLVASSASCHVVTSLDSLFIGSVAALVMMIIQGVMDKYRIDDVVGAVPVHGGGGAWGTLAVAIFGDLDSIGTGLTRLGQFQIQALGVLLAFCFSFSVVYLFLRCIGPFFPFRVSKNDEEIGLNVSEHKEANEFMDLISTMGDHARTHNTKMRANENDFTEFGRIAKYYNGVVESLDNAMKKIRLILDSVSEGIYELDLNGNIVYANPSARRILGYSGDEMIGKMQTEFVKSKVDAIPGAGGIESRIQKVHQCKTPVQITDSSVIQKTGRVIPIDYLSNPILDGDTMLGTVVTVRDISEQKLLSELSRQKESIEMKTRFISTVSHELRTPLTSIKEGVGMVADGSLGPVSDHQKQLLDLSKRNVDRLTRLINDVLDFQKMEMGKVELRLTEVNLNDLVKSVCQSQGSVIKKKKLNLEMKVDASIPPIRLDSDRIEQVLFNLMTNAIKFTKNGKIGVYTSIDNNNAVVCIEDSGIGISEEDTKQLFRQFVQLDAGKDRKTGSTGLGLAISKKIIDLHNGKIWVDSTEGEGSSFYFSIPIIERRKER